MSIEEVDQIRKHLVILRTAKDISQADLAEAVGVNQAQISRIENGDKADISLSMLVKICQELNILVEEIIDPAAFTKQLTELLLDDNDTNSSNQDFLDTESKQAIPENVIRMDNPYTPPEGLLPIGSDKNNQVIGFDNSLLDRHMMVVGKTGSGKSEWLKWALHGITQTDYPTVLIDPHGALSDDILNSMIVNDPDKLDRVLFINIANADWPVAFNPLDVETEEDIDKSVNSVFAMLSAPAFGFDRRKAPRATIYLRDALTALCHANLALKKTALKCNLAEIIDFFTDASFRRRVIEVCPNENIRQKYDSGIGSFELMGEKLQIKHTQVIIKIINNILASKALSQIFSTSSNKIDFSKWINEKRIVILKCSQFGDRGDNMINSAAGAAIISYLLSSKKDWGRSKDPMTGKTSGSGCRIIVDEAPTILGPDSNVPELLAEARSWDLGIIMSAQYLNQFDDKMVDGLLTNTNSKISFVQDVNTGSVYKHSMMGAADFDLSKLANFHFYANILARDEDEISSTGPFEAACLPLLASKMTAEDVRKRKEIVDCSRQEVANSSEGLKEMNENRKEEIIQALRKHLP